MNAGATRPMGHGAHILLQDAQQLATLLVQRAHAAAMSLDGLAPDEGWQPQQIGSGALAWVRPTSPAPAPPEPSTP